MFKGKNAKPSQIGIMVRSESMGVFEILQTNGGISLRQKIKGRGVGIEGVL